MTRSASEVTGIAGKVVVAVSTLALMAISLLFTASFVTLRTAPGLAARLWPANTLAQGALAGTIMLDPSTTGARLSMADRAARRALSSSPGDAVAAWAAGLIRIAQGNGAAGERLLTYSEKLSRRELAAQLALIQIEVDKGRVVPALTHYDRALRVGEVVPALLQTLGAAADDPSIRPALIRLLRRAPPWRTNFLVYLNRNSRSWLGLWTVYSSLHLRPGAGLEQEALRDAIAKIVASGHVEEARSLLPDRSAAAIRNGGFEEANLYSPLDWDVAQDSDLNAATDHAPDGWHGNVLSLTAENGRGGRVATELVSLRPGRYRFALTAGDVSGDDAERPTVTIACKNGAALAGGPIPVTQAAKRVQWPVFTVPSGCEAQEIAVDLASATTPGLPHPWIDDLTVTNAPS